MKSNLAVSCVFPKLKTFPDICWTCIVRCVSPGVQLAHLEQVELLQSKRIAVAYAYASTLADILV